MIDKNRPLSPHLQIYKPQITSITSILHRLSGVALYFGVLLLCGLIPYYTYQINILDTPYKCDCWVTRSIIYVVMFGWTLALFYHLCNGIRHLFWDIGKGFDIKTAEKTGLIVIAAAFTLTVICFTFVFVFKLT